MPSPIALGELKSFSIRLSNAFELETFQAYDGGVRHAHGLFVSKIVTAADYLQVEDGRPLDVSLATFAKKIPSLPVVLDDPALKKAKRNFVKRLRNPKCDVCAGETKCGRDKVEHDLLGERGQCIEALLDLLTQLRRLCDELYCTRGAGSPSVRLALWRPDQSDKDAILERFGISAWHKLARSEPPVSVVNLTIELSRFGLRSAYALYYVILHELICHASQGSASTARRRPAELNCAWSEGWMDKLAFELSEFWLNNGAAVLPAWLTSGGTEVEAISNALHEERLGRTPGGAPRTSGDDNRPYAREAFRILWKEMGRDIPLSRNDITAFSIRVNMQAAEPEERDLLAVELIQLLKDPKTERFRKTVRWCRELAIEQRSWEDFKTSVAAALSERGSPVPDDVFAI